MAPRGVWDLAKQSGAYTCLHKDHTTGEELAKAIQLTYCRGVVCPLAPSVVVVVLVVVDVELLGLFALSLT